SIDGDGAAAMRYTEARLSNIAMEMLKDIDKETVEMVPNYSDSEMEPKVLPSRYPNLLVNGAFGIAVGLATNIPPHNLGEVTEGVLAYIDNNEIDTKGLMEYIKGPDLPTGGILIGEKSILAAYETGDGKVSYRAKTNIETLENGRLGIVITEFPYRRNKARILQTISEMTGDKKHSKVLESITDIRDESDRNGIRAVIEFKKATDEKSIDKVLKYLFKKTELQCNISFNMVALADGKPEKMGLKKMIEYYVEHQKEIVFKRSTRELAIAEKRFHIVEGFIKAIDVLDEVIKTIRASKSKKDASVNLMEKFEFTEIQANAILEMMLYRLTGLEINVYKKEYDELLKTIKKLKKILGSEKELLKVVKKELIEVSEKYKDDRRTKIIEDDSLAKIDMEDLVVVEDIMITISNEGFIKRMPHKNYLRSNADKNEIDYREGDFLRFLIQSNTRDTLLIFTEKGNMYQTKGINIVEGKWKDKGERIEDIVRGLNLEEEKIVNIISITTLNPSRYIQFITNAGMIKNTSLDNFKTSYSKLQAIKLKGDEKIVKVTLFNEEEKENFLEVQTRLGLRFNLDIGELENTPKNLLGKFLFNLSENDEVISYEYRKELEFKEFGIALGNKNIFKLSSRISKNDTLKVYTDTLSHLLLFTDKGNMFKIKAFMLEKVIEEDIALSKVIDGLEKDENIIRLYSIKEYKEELGVYAITKKGIIKKTSLKEFEGDYINGGYYKLKSKDDSVVVTFIDTLNDGNIIMLTKKGVMIKFNSSGVTQMGKFTSGVTGITLKDGEEVVYATLLEDDYYDLSVITKEKVENKIFIKDLKLQNRAGRGSSVIQMNMEDEVKNIQLIKK
ncbi:MAG: DNA gyrase subunit A, partial [Clostridium sp.]